MATLKETDQHVWVANVSMTSEILLGVDWGKAENEMGELVRKSKDGEQLSAADYPKRVLSKKAKTKPKAILLPGALIAVRPMVAEILRGMDMGSNSLYPFEFFERDGETPVEGGPFHFLNVCEMKTAVHLERSGGAIKATRNLRRPSVVARQDIVGLSQGEHIHVTSSALVGADIWIDTQMTQSIFFSDRLVSALRAIKADRPIEFFPCPVLPATALH